ncbi:MAG: hypothetical protein E5Y31_24350, partial [Mesorhizobium sp.]
RVWAQAKIWALVMGLGGLAYGCAIMFVLPMIKSQALQDASVGFIGIFVIANFVPIMLYIMPRIVLEILGDFRIVAFTTLGGAVVGLVLIAILLAIASPPWALVGSAMSEIFVLLASWYFAHHRIWNLEHPDEARDSRLGSWRRAVTFATVKR